MSTSFDHLVTPSADVLALGEPTHGDPGLGWARNDLLPRLADLGVRSVAVESDAVAALDGRFSHGFGERPDNRALLDLVRADDRLRFYGFDGATETYSAPSPRPYLAALHAYLGERAPLPWGAFDDLLGEDGPWARSEAVLDAAESIGATPAAIELRAATEDLIGALIAHAPDLVAASSAEAWHRADVQARTARGLLRYHAACARPGSPAVRMAGLLAARSAIMVEHLLAIRARERDRGPTLVFAHNAHLRRGTGRWPVGGGEAEWRGAGAILASLLGERYVFVAGSLGASPALGLETPAAGTIEAALDALEGELIDPAAVPAAAAPRPGGSLGYAPLDRELLGEADALLHVGSPAIDVEELTARLRSLPGVGYQQPDEEWAWGGRFFFAGEDRMMPFATIVDRDSPGDDRSRLDRPGAYRFNVHLGRREFVRRLGFAPRDVEARLGDLDLTSPDHLLPHPVYGRQAWGGIVNPTARSLRLIDDLTRAALARRTRGEDTHAPAE